MRATLRTLAAAWLGLLLFSTSPASAQLLTFVAATGNDANTCLVQANPCKTLQKAINVTAATGEVRILSQLQSNGFVNKSITIDGGGNTVIGTIAINSASAIVTLKNLSLNGFGAFPTGINIINAAVAHIEESTIERFGSGIQLSENVSTELFVSDSILRDNGSHGLWVKGPSSARLTVDDSRFENNGGFGLVADAGQVSVNRSVASGNHTGFNLFDATANFVETISAGNAAAGFESYGEMTLESSVARGNATGLFVNGGDTARISNTLIADNTTGIDNNGAVLTRGNNVLVGNTTQINGAALTTLGGL